MICWCDEILMLFFYFLFWFIICWIIRIIGIVDLVFMFKYYGDMESVFLVFFFVIYSFSFVLCSSSWWVFRLWGVLFLWWYEGCLWKFIFINYIWIFIGKFDIIVSIWMCIYDNWKIIFFLNFYFCYVVEMYDYKLDNLIKWWKLWFWFFVIKNRFLDVFVCIFYNIKKKIINEKI